jgi:hypothetical protein
VLRVQMDSAACITCMQHARLQHTNPAVHVRAGVLVAAFQHVPQHRGAIMDELVGNVLPHAFTAKAVPRATALVSESQPSIYIVTSLVLQMLQVILHWLQASVAPAICA